MKVKITQQKVLGFIAVLVVIAVIGMFWTNDEICARVFDGVLTPMAVKIKILFLFGFVLQILILLILSTIIVIFISDVIDGSIVLFSPFVITIFKPKIPPGYEKEFQEYLKEKKLKDNRK